MPKAPQTYAKTNSARLTTLIREMTKELPPVVGDFIYSIEDQYSPMTRLSYLYDLRLFFNYLISEVPRFADLQVSEMTLDEIRGITQADLERYPNYLTLYYKNNSDEPIENAEAGKMRKLCSLRSFYKYLFAHKYVPGNIAELIPLPKLRQKEIIRLEPDEVARLLDAAESGEGFGARQKTYTAHTRVRDVAILTLLLGTGIRVSECVGLNTDDLNFEENSMFVTRKGGKEMILYFSDEVASALKAYLAERKDVQPLPGHEGALFLSLQRRRITQRAIENLVKKYAAIAAPLKRKISPHKLRSTYGTTLYNETGDIYLVADVLGHADVNTTRRHYAAMSENRRRMAAKAVKLRDDEHGSSE
ncbi:MAG: tyrosine-type recombinase/integrase [Clostridiales bacterium]|nr:tyrosine-type recombinase/integrase [Clostridiales bacterium]MDY2833936.1 tyrosine-type recombinase/integrase [Candidatus Aphodomonas sp.]